MKKKVIICITLILVVLLCIILIQWYQSCPLPVLMYHHFTDEADADTCVTPETFRKQLTALKNAGFTTVTIHQVIDYVNWGIPLPDKPILITIDDGYTSNLTLAAPILEELDMCATIFVIGLYEGKTIDDVHSGNTLYPERLTYDDANEWIEKGVIDLQSHSFDMHQLASDGYSGRDGMLMLDGESVGEYKEALEFDYVSFCKKRAGRVDTSLVALAYPYGYYTQELDAILADIGYKITFTIDERCSKLRVGDKETLRMLGRFNVTDRCSGEELVAWLEGAIKSK